MYQEVKKLVEKGSTVIEVKPVVFDFCAEYHGKISDSFSTIRDLARILDDLEMISADCFEKDTKKKLDELIVTASLVFTQAIRDISSLGEKKIHDLDVLIKKGIISGKK